MSKRKNKGKYKPKMIEGIVVGLQLLASKPSSDRESAQSLLSWYLSNHFLTDKQQMYAKSLIARNRAKKSEKPKKYHLYAIGDGECVKLGVSTDVGKRLNSMQTGHPKKLKVLWKFFVGRERAPAFKAEKKLHKYCKKFKLRGEWFKGDSMTIVRQFSIKEKMAMQNEQESHDLSILESSPI